MTPNLEHGLTPLGHSAVQIFAANERINQMLIERLDLAAWNAPVPAVRLVQEQGRKIRTIAAIFAHMHNVRVKWIRLSAPQLRDVPRLNRSQRTVEEVRAALAESADRCCEMLHLALGRDHESFSFRRDGWARRWPAGLEMLCYMLSHEAHHRGQVCLVAHLLGFPLADQVQAGMWNWEKILKEDSGSVHS